MLFCADQQMLTIILLLVCIVPLFTLIIISFIKGIARQKKAQKDHQATADKNPADLTQKALFTDAFGGEGNITCIEAKLSRITVKVKDLSLVNADALKALGASGVLFTEDMVKASFGDRAPYVYQLLSAPSATASQGDESHE